MKNRKIKKLFKTIIVLIVLFEIYVMFGFIINSPYHKLKNPASVSDEILAAYNIYLPKGAKATEICNFHYLMHSHFITAKVEGADIEEIKALNEGNLIGMHETDPFYADNEEYLSHPVIDSYLPVRPFPYRNMKFVPTGYAVTVHYDKRGNIWLSADTDYPFATNAEEEYIKAAEKNGIMELLF